jgi:hypothetical protein
MTDQQPITPPPELSPAAQAVLDAFRSSHTGQGCLAAALRAAALYCTRERRILMTIAAELDGANSTSENGHLQ